MTKKIKLKRAFHEAWVDTAIAGIVAIPLNFLLVYFCIQVWELGPLYTSVILNVVFITYGIGRKTFVRLHFEEKHNNQLDKPK